MTRSFTIAKSEFLSLVQTKFFIIGMLMMPIIVGASIGFQVMAARRIDRDDRAFGVVDRTGALYGALEREATDRNQRMGRPPDQKGPHFVPQRLDVGGRPLDDVRLEASARVKRKELFAFVEIPPTVFSVEAADPIAYYTDTPSYDTLPDWLETTLGKQIAERRFQDAGIDAKLVDRLNRRVSVSTLELVQRGADGSVAAVDALVIFDGIGGDAA